MKRELLCTLVLGGLLAGGATAAQRAQLMSGEDSPVSSLIKQMKADGEQIPTDVRQMSAELYGYELNTNNFGADRDGGETAATATPVVFTAGVFTDTGSTANKVGDIGKTLGIQNLCTNQSYSSSMLSRDAFYSFTLATESTVGVTTVLPGTTYDTCIAIVGADGVTIKSINDDAPGDAAYRSALSCCLPAGSYYVVVDGYSAADYGDYEIQITSDGLDCIPNAFACPSGSLPYNENNEFGCGDYAHSIDCGQTYCGDITTGADHDYYWFTVTAPMTTITLNVYGDDTSGRAPFGWGLDPYITVYNEDCSTVIAEDDDAGVGFDSQLLLECMTPGFYIIEVNTAWDNPGPYLLTMNCAVCCWETNSPTNPAVVVDASNFMNFVGEANAYTTTANLADFCSILNVGPGNFSNGHHVEQLNGGEFWFNVYQPLTGCYAMYMSVDPAYTTTCTPLVGVAQNGALLGWFATDASLGLFPSNYNNLGTDQTTFVIDAPAACDQDVHVSIWYEDLCPPVEAGDQPVSFALSQNVPNPFNPTTTISFSLPEAGIASLKVYDTAGREVATLVNGMSARGEHQVTFDGSKLSTGVYFYTLQFNGASETQKMVLVK